MTLGADGDVLSVTVTEPRFTRGDVEALIASRRVQREPRGPHGVLISEATDPKLKGRWEIPKPRRDYVAEKLHGEQKRYRDLYPHEDQSAFLWTARLQEE